MKKNTFFKKKKSIDFFPFFFSGSSNIGTCNKHDSPIIVHQSDKPSRVSFDLSNEDTAAKLDAVIKDNLAVPTDNEVVSSSGPEEARDIFPCSASSGSSCHSSR